MGRASNRKWARRNEQARVAFDSLVVGLKKRLTTTWRIKAAIRLGQFCGHRKFTHAASVRALGGGM